MLGFICTVSLERHPSVLPASPHGASCDAEDAARTSRASCRKTALGPDGRAGRSKGRCRETGARWLLLAGLEGIW